MLRVKIVKQNNQVKKINLLGHAGYDVYGKDIVCSSISSIMITTVNAIEKFGKGLITYCQGKDNFEIIINKNEKIVDNLIENMLDMLKQLEEDYPKNIKIEEE